MEKVIFIGLSAFFIFYASWQVVNGLEWIIQRSIPRSNSKERKA